MPDMKKFFQAADPVYKNAILSFPLTATDQLVLTAETAKRYTLPTNTGIILFDATKDICVLFGDSDVEANLDEEDILDGSAPMWNPGVICNIPFSGITHASVISPYDCVVTILRWCRK